MSVFVGDTWFVSHILYLVYRFLSTTGFVSSADFTWSQKQKCEFLSHVANSLSAPSTTSDGRAAALLVLRGKRDIDFLPFEERENRAVQVGQAVGVTCRLPSPLSFTTSLSVNADATAAQSTCSVQETEDWFCGKEEEWSPLLRMTNVSELARRKQISSSFDLNASGQIFWWILRKDSCYSGSVL